MSISLYIYINVYFSLIYRKPMSENQWWELLDTASNDYYYHNPHTGQTVWDRPDSDDIITLTSLQV